MYVCIYYREREGRYIINIRIYVLRIDSRTRGHRDIGIKGPQKDIGVRENRPQDIHIHIHIHTGIYIYTYIYIYTHILVFFNCLNHVF